MSKYRFKTQEEFYRDGQWNDDNHCPLGWSLSGDMNHYLGQDVPEGANESCEVGGDFTDDGWYFQPTDYVLKEEDYTGRWIKAFVDNPNHTSVKLGEIIQIVSRKSNGNYILDKTSSGYSGMGIQCPLNTSEWELVEEPKQNFKVVPGYVRCVQALIHAKAGKIYPVVDEKHCLCEQGNTYEWDSQEFMNSTKQEYDAQFPNEQDPLYICKQEYRKGMRVRSAAKAGVYSGEFIIDVDPREFRNLSGNKDVVDYSFSNGYLYFNGEYAEILEEGVYDVSEIIKTNKPSIESVQSVDVNLRTKKQINKFKF
jgi:hypothetical protein